MTLPVPDGWRNVLAAEIKKPYFVQLQKFLDAERNKHPVFPFEQEVFAALELTAYDDVNVLLLGQDPYHGEHQAHGLCFSVRPGVTPPPSLQNIFQELHDDAGCPIPNNGYLESWARQGVLMLNAVLTVRARRPNSHQNKGWETFTDTIIRAVNAKENRVVFILWGNYARKKTPLIDATRHLILQAAHPSPFSAQRGFFGSKPFSKTNAALATAGAAEIDWCIPDL